MSQGKQLLDALKQPLLPHAKAQRRNLLSKLIGKLKPANKARFRRRRDDDFGIKTIGQFGSFVYLVNQIFGTGVIAIPNVVASSGWLPALLADGFVCCAAGIGTLMMLRCMTLVKGNRNFEKRLEYMAVMERFLCVPLYNFVQVCFYLSILSSNLASIIVVAQAVDHILVKIFTFSLMIQIYPYPWLRILDTKLLDSVYGDKQLTLGITIGYLVTALGCIPLALQTMEENMRVQYISFTFLICTLGGLCITAAVKITRFFPNSVSRDNQASLSVVDDERPLYTMESQPQRAEELKSSRTDGLPYSSPDLVKNPMLTSPPPFPSKNPLIPPITKNPLLPMNIAHTIEPSNSSSTYIPAFLLLTLLGRRLLRRRRLDQVDRKGRQLSAVVKVPSPFGHSNYGELISTFLASYSFVNTIPSWANEMTWTVDVVAAVKYASIFAFAVYYIFGYMMAFAYPNAHTDNILQAVLADTDRSSWQLFLVYAFDLITVAPGILVYCITMRYNLMNSENMTRSQSVFWGAFFPFLLAWLVSNESHFSTLLTWSSLVFSLMVNFIAPCLIFLVACCVSKPSQRNPVYDAKRNALQNLLISTGFQISFWCASEKALEQFVQPDDTEYQFIQLQFRPGQPSSSTLLPLEAQCPTSTRETPCCVTDLLLHTAIKEQTNNPFAPSPASLRSPSHPRRYHQLNPARSNTSRFSRDTTPLFCRHALFPAMGNDSMSSRMYSGTRRQSQTLSSRNAPDRLLPFGGPSPAQLRDSALSPAQSLTLAYAEQRFSRPFPGIKRRLSALEFNPPFPAKVSRLYMWDTVAARRQALMLERKKRRDLLSAEGGVGTGDRNRSRRSYHLVTDRWRRKLRQSYPHMNSWSVASGRAASQVFGRNAMMTQSMSLWPWTERGDVTTRIIRQAVPASVPHSVRSSAVEDVYLRRMFESHKYAEGTTEQFESWSECGPTAVNSFSHEADLRESQTHVLNLPPNLEEQDGDEEGTARSSVEQSSPLLSTVGSECVFTTEGFRDAMKTSSSLTKDDLCKLKEDGIESYRPKPDHDSPRRPRICPPIPRKRSPPFLSADQYPCTSRSMTCQASPVRKRAELMLPIGPARKWSPAGVEESTCPGLDSDEESSEAPPPIKGAEDAYEQDEDILGEVKNIRIHVFPKGILRRNHIEFTVILLFMLTCSCILTASLRIIDDLTLAAS